MYVRTYVCMHVCMYEIEKKYEVNKKLKYERNRKLAIFGGDNRINGNPPSNYKWKPCKQLHM